MFLKLDLFLICVFLFNVCEVRSDCDDFITCVGSWIGDLLVNDSKEVAAKAVEVPDVLSDVGDILTNISHLIEDKFDTITKETSLVKNIENKTVIHVQTFKVGNKTFNKSNETFQTNKTELPGTVKNNNSESDISNVSLHRKENQTANINELKNDDLKLTTEISVAVTELANAPPGDSVNLNKILYNLLNGIGSKYYNESLKRTLGEENINKKASAYQKSSTSNFEEIDTYETTEITEKLNVTHKSPVNENNFETINSSNNENQNSSSIFINIPQTVASNYKITFESPINVTYFEITTKEETETTTNLKDINVNRDTDVNKNIINQNTEENEIIMTDDEDYNTDEENITDYLAIDYIELYKDTTNEDMPYTTPTYTLKPIEAVETTDKMREVNGIESVFLWIATLFIKNNENNQFEYICDGAVVSDVVILTAARCVTKSNATENVSDILVILGKRSLQATGPNEKVVRVKSVKLHENFTAAEGKVDNDLAIIVLEEPLVFNDDIQPVPLKYDDFEAIQSATTGWHVTGPLTPIYFGNEPSKTCKKDSDALYTFCATFGDNITTCPSYGGLFLSRRTETDWGFQGIASGNPTNKGVCFNKNVTFTNLSYYYQWIMENIDANKVN